MRHRKDFRKLSRSSSHRRALFRNMATSLILHGRIQTTEAKAKELRRVADRLVTIGKRYKSIGDAGGEDKEVASQRLHVHRRMLGYLKDKKAIEILFTDLAARFENRPGGYTRVVKLGFRQGDAAPLAFIEFIPEEVKEKETKSKRRRRRRKDKGEDEMAAAPVSGAKGAKAKAAPVPVEDAPGETAVEAPDEDAAEEVGEDENKED
ncbi:50S ribosomal protein L17 [bacterium]|nr:50S ribosomal protein L17 [bacterium]